MLLGKALDSCQGIILGSILNERLTLFENGMEETFRTRPDPFAHKKFSNLSPEILVEWIALSVF